MTAAVSLTWTNPPDADLAGVQILAKPSYGDTLEVIYRGRWEAEDSPVIIVPGGQETLSFALPCRSSPQVWQFWVRGFDWAGNVAALSNMVEVTR